MKLRCGTLRGYQAHLENSESPCEQCRLALSTYHRDRRKIARERQQCGYVSGIVQHLKRCEPLCEDCSSLCDRLFLPATSSGADERINIENIELALSVWDEFVRSAN